MHSSNRVASDDQVVVWAVETVQCVSHILDTRSGALTHTGRKKAERTDATGRESVHSTGMTTLLLLLLQPIVVVVQILQPAGRGESGQNAPG